MHALFSRSAVVAALSLLLALSGCGDDTNPDAGSGAADAGGGSCPGAVVIGFFTDPDCTVPVGGPGGERSYDLTATCFSWEGSSAAGQNSATGFQCYRDRVCYAQHANSLSCDSPMATNKEARTGACVVDTEGAMTIYARLISGSESCPEAPDGFECPTGGAAAGTLACRTSP